MNYIIIENEEYALAHLRQTIESVRPDWELVFTAETVEDAVALLSRHNRIDVAFMDIELDDGNCFEIFTQTEVTCPVIFTTAYDQYAIQAFKVNSVDYLLKPILQRDVVVAIEKLERMRRSMSPAIDYSRLLDALQPGRQVQAPRRILITSGDAYTYVETGDIAFVTSEDKYVFIYLNSGQRRITDFASLADVMPVLNPGEFFQLARNLIARADAIGAVRKYFKGRLEVTVRAGSERQTVIVSAARRQDFLDWLGYTPH